jgi:hypothetical protein
MKEIVSSFTPFFNSVLYNHQSISLIEFSFLFSILIFQIFDTLAAQKTKTSFALMMFLVILPLFPSACYVLFCELIWWKAIVNILVSIYAFTLISKVIILFFQISIHGFYRFQTPESEGVLKRRAFVFISFIIIIAICLNVMIKNSKF